MLSSELGHILQSRRDWDGALEHFDAGLANARLLHGAPGFTVAEGEPAVRLWGNTLAQWQSRALRGQGFCLVELNRLDDAERAYRAALALDPNDAQATKELALIEQLRR